MKPQTLSSPKGSIIPATSFNVNEKTAIVMIGAITDASISKSAANPTEFFIKIPDAFTSSKPSLTYPPRYGM